MKTTLRQKLSWLCNKYGVDFSEVIGGNRKRDFAMIRKVFCYLNNTEEKRLKIQKLINIDKTTFNYYIESVDNMIYTDDYLIYTYKELINK